MENYEKFVKLVMNGKSVDYTNSPIIFPRLMKCYRSRKWEFVKIHRLLLFANSSSSETSLRYVYVYSILVAALFIEIEVDDC